jgi:glycerol uptake facilitator-like aquaporin
MQTRRAITMEFLGTAILAVGIVGSGHMVAYLASDNGLKLFINALATGIALAVAIRIGMKISGAHFNPVVTIIMLIIRKIEPKISVLYITAQVLGAICGSAFANLMFDQKLFQVSSINRDGSNLFVSELFTTAILLWIILRFPKREDLISIYAPLWIFGAILLSSSTSFANPAITIGRIFTNSIVGIAPDSVIPFIIAQIIGGLLALMLARQVTNPEKMNNGE